MRDLVVAITLLLAGSPAAAQRADHDRAVQRLHEGQIALQAEHWAEAEDAFKEALALDPLLDLAHYGLGQVYMATKRYPDAIREFDRSREVFGVNAVQRLANNVEADHRLEEQIQALRDYRRELDRGRVRTANTGATISRLDSQIGQLEVSRHRSETSPPPTPPYILVALGSAYFRSGAFADAEREWRAAAAIDPKIGEVHNNLAVVLMLTGRYDESTQEVTLAERAGFPVSPAFKDELGARKRAPRP